MNGWIKIHRQLLKWEWYDEPNTLRLFLHLLLKANHVEGEWRGIVINPGQLLTGRKKLSQELKLSEQEIRTSIKRLISTNEITIKPTNKYSIITVCNWGSYQANNTNEQPTEQPTKQPENNQQLTTNKNNKNIKNIISVEINYPFELFWHLYDKKTGNKDKLKDKWNKLKPEERHAIMDYIPLYKESQPDKQFRKNPSTFLNNKAWKDEIIHRNRKPTNGHKTEYFPTINEKAI